MTIGCGAPAFVLDPAPTPAPDRMDAPLLGNTPPAMLPPDTPTVMPPDAAPLGCVLVCMSMRVERAPDAVVVRTCALPQIAMASECFFAIRSVTYMIERTWDAFTRVKRKQQRHE